MAAATTSTGIRRKVDDLGRIVIPAGMRHSLNIREGDTLEVAIEDERIVLARPRELCVFCGRGDGELLRFRNRLLCEACVTAVRDLPVAATSAATPAAGLSPEPPIPDPGPGPLPPDPHPPQPAPDPVPPGPGPDPSPTPEPDPGPSPQPGPTPQPGPAPQPEPQPAPTQTGPAPVPAGQRSASTTDW
ncbi:MAG: AbrB/MazE/SpoVT family DNA-binding domain-containing protein [Nitriliruptoraceae bacterium]